MRESIQLLDMRICILLLVSILIGPMVVAQRDCGSFEYEQMQLRSNPELVVKLQQVEQFIQEQRAHTSLEQSRPNGIAKVVIPVVVHILYNSPSGNISDEQVFKQIDILNNCFRRQNADTLKTPERFLGLAADCEIEFQLAKSDPKMRATNGIVRKYTPVTYWDDNDKMKFTAEAGDDAWDASSYLNIWVCNLRRTAAYASFPGGPVEKDGVVVNHAYFGPTTHAAYDMGKTVVHEAGHWLGLKHIWGDAYCGDDLVDDTPKQGNFTSGCPTGIRTSCSNQVGDMYMNYMDLSSDACMNLFTKGQKERMLAQFKTGGARNSIFFSKGLQPPTNNEIPLPEEQPKWQHPQLYPNPASAEVIIDFSHDVRWLGKTLVVTNAQGQVMLQEPISAKIHRINISRLKPGIYFINSKKQDGATLKTKFIKM